MSIFYAPYELKSEHGSRHGALLKVNEGYADFHPWPELGDLPLADELKALAQGRPTALGQRALACVQLDAQARRGGHSLFGGLNIPLSHALLGSADLKSIEKIKEQNFSKIKIKIQATQLSAELHSFLNDLASLGFWIRLDANGSFETVESFLTFYDSLTDLVKNSLDFIGDPLPYQEKSWRSLRHVPVALDRKVQVPPKIHNPPEDLVLDPYPFEHLILKPAIDDVSAWLEVAHANMLRVVVTSYLGHPLGCAYAAYVAAVIAQKHPLLIDECGLLSYRAYKSTAYTDLLSQQGPEFVAPSGNGLGFDSLLKDESWIKL